MNNKCKSVQCNNNAGTKCIKDGKKIYYEYCYHCLYAFDDNYRGRMIFNSYRTDAAKRGFEFKIDKEFLLKMCKKDCSYCGNPGRGIDRVDNLVGYIESNCVPCCTICNKMKSNRTEEEFLRQVDSIYTFQHKYE